MLRRFNLFVNKNRENLHSSNKAKCKDFSNSPKKLKEIKSCNRMESIKDNRKINQLRSKKNIHKETSEMSLVLRKSFIE